MTECPIFEIDESELDFSSEEALKASIKKLADFEDYINCSEIRCNGKSIARLDIEDGVNTIIL